MPNYATISTVRFQFSMHGNFVGNNLVVVEEIINKIRNTFVDGATIERAGNAANRLYLRYGKLYDGCIAAGRQSDRQI